MLPPDYYHTFSDGQQISNLPNYNDNLGGHSELLGPKEKRSSTLRLVLEKKESKDIDTWYSGGSIVSGSMVVHPFKPVKVKAIVVDLVVKETVFVRPNGLGNGIKMTRKVKLASCAIHPELFPSDRVLDPATRYHFNFSLQFPHTLPSRENTALFSTAQNLLPPTLGALADVDDILPGQDITDGSLRINYTLEARIEQETTSTRDAEIFASCMRHLKFSPTDTDFVLGQLNIPANDLTHCSTKLLKQGVLRKPFGEFFMSTKDHTPISINPQGDGLNKLTVGFNFTPRCNMQPPPQIKRVTVNLVSYTYTSRSSIKSYTDYTKPGVDNVCTEKYRLSKLDGPSLVWSAGPEPLEESAILNMPSSNEKIGRNTTSVMEESLITENISDGVSSFHSRLTIPIVIPKTYANKTIPTFFGLMSSRQYEIHIHVAFKNGASADLMVPVILARRPYETSGIIPSYTTSCASTFSSITSESDDVNYTDMFPYES